MKLTPAMLEAVIEALQQKFPDELPYRPTTIEQIHMLIGQKQVVKYLKELRDSL